jgi:hypothetical protein
LTFKLVFFFFFNFGGEAWNTLNGGGMKLTRIFASLEITANFKKGSHIKKFLGQLKKKCLRTRYVSLREIIQERRIYD